MHTNRLIDARSPYLLQHARNPVDWHEWGAEALQRAREEDKPILVSIGYSACHWCHVMERESFENEAIAALMNERFVCIKVDREERPDLDDLYMTAAQMLTGSGGWPLNVFLMPDLKPFYAGTYFPPDDRWGRPGFAGVLRGVSQAYRDRRAQIEEAAASLTEALSGREASGALGEPSIRLIETAVASLGAEFDERWGGWGGAPRFPSAATIELLLRHHRRTGDPSARRMATRTLDAMAHGGIYDQLGGGFHRYSVDERWLVPHFEKMLYDNALLTVAYLDGYQATGHEEYARVARETLDYLLREMTDEAGGFHSATDADSEGEEGRYFVWDPAEITAVLGAEEAELFGACYGVTASGHLEGRSVLHVSAPPTEVAAQRGIDPAELQAALDVMRRKLLAERQRRTPPGTDDKVLADWNGLAIRALARAYRVLGDETYREAAERAARFVWTQMQRDGDLQHAYRDGESYVDGYLDDHACVLQGLIDLYEATFDAAWLDRARAIADGMTARFWDTAAGGFFLTTADRPDLIARPKRTLDGATPSGNAVAAQALLRLGRLTGEPAYAAHAEQTLRALVGQAERMPRAFPALLCAVDEALAPPMEVVIVGPMEDSATRALLSVGWEGYAPERVVVVHDPASAEAPPAPAQGKQTVGGRATVYVCDAGGCRAPVTSTEELRALLRR